MSHIATAMNNKLIIIALAAAAFGSACYRPENANARSIVAPGPAAASTPSSDERNIIANSVNSEKNTNKEKEATGFLAALPGSFETPADGVGARILREYGSLFVAGPSVRVPPRVMFRDDSEATGFQSALDVSSESIGGYTVELQTPALKALKAAIEEAKAAGLTITPRAADSSKRTYAETVGLWKSRVEPALAHWTAQGRITAADSARIKALTPSGQVPEVLKLEEQGIYFSKDLSKSILYSVAPPGASQHLSLLALDVKEFGDPKVRAVLARHGWFQTVQSDLPHFTYLGWSEADLPSKGLRSVTVDGQRFWVPDIR